MGCGDWAATGLAVRVIATNRDTTRMASPPAILQTFNERVFGSRARWPPADAAPVNVRIAKSIGLSIDRRNSHGLQSPTGLKVFAEGQTIMSSRSIGDDDVDRVEGGGGLGRRQK